LPSSHYSCQWGSFYLQFFNEILINPLHSDQYFHKQHVLYCFVKSQFFFDLIVCLRQWNNKVSQNIIICRVFLD
jgi:hypothetical protein